MKFKLPKINFNIGKKLAESKIWNTLFKQVIPFFMMIIFLLTIIVVFWSLALCSKDISSAQYAIDLAKEFVTGIAIAVCAFVLGKAADHWLQDHYNLDGDGKPLNCKDISDQ